MKNKLLKKLLKLHDNFNKRISYKHPLLSLYLYHKPRNLLKFRIERMHYKGRRQSMSTERSIVFFTAHTCASVFINQLINKLVNQKGLVHIDLDGYMSSTDRKMYDIFSNQEKLKKLLPEQGYYFGAFRSFRDIPNLEQYKVILVLRDPRDILVSHYYSIKHSHAVVNKNVYNKRIKSSNQEIDDFVIEHAPRFKETFQEYKHLINQEYCLFLRYEDMIYQPQKWIKILAEYLNVTIEASTWVWINEKTQIKSKEDIYSHDRKKTPGDHMMKLSEQTIDYLSGYFSDELKYFGFN